MPHMQPPTSEAGSRRKNFSVPLSTESRLTGIPRMPCLVQFVRVLLFLEEATNYGIKSHTDSVSNSYGVRQLILREDQSQELLTCR